MKTVKGNSILIWTIVALVVLNLSTLATIFYQRKSDLRRSEEYSVEIKPNKVSEADKFSGRYFRDKLHLTSEQMQEFQSFNPEFRREARRINIRLEEIRFEMLDEMASSDTDTLKLEALAILIGDQHSQLKRITFRYYQNLKKICTRDQQLLLKELFSEPFGNDSRSDSGNRGKGNRRFRGGFKN